MSRYLSLTPARLALLTLVSLGLGALPSSAGTTAARFAAYLPAVSCPTCTGDNLPPTPTPQPTPTPEHPDLLEAQMITLVNQARVAAGCPPATPSSILMRATGDWSAYMRNHNLGEHAPSNWYTEPPYSYPTNAVLENIAGGSDIASYVFNGWMESPLHRRNLEWCYHPDDPSYDPNRLYEIGVGYADGYWTLAIADRAP